MLNDELLKNYAKVMVHYALNNGKGINTGDTVFLVGQENTKPLFLAIGREVYSAGGNLITHYQPDNHRDQSLIRYLLENGSDEQIGFLPSLTGRGSWRPPIISSLSSPNPIFITWKDCLPQRSAG